MKVTIKGLDEFGKQLEDLAKAIDELKRTFHGRKVNFEADDPADVERSIRELEADMDAKLARFRNSPAAREIIDKFRQAIRQQIEELARQNKGKSAAQG